MDRLNKIKTLHLFINEYVLIEPFDDNCRHEATLKPKRVRCAARTELYPVFGDINIGKQYPAATLLPGASISQQRPSLNIFTIRSK